MTITTVQQRPLDNPILYLYHLHHIIINLHQHLTAPTPSSDDYPNTHTLIQHFTISTLVTYHFHGTIYQRKSAEESEQEEDRYKAHDHVAPKQMNESTHTA